MITFALQLFLITILVINGSQASCDDNEYVCDNGSCIDSFLVCDGEKNCVDGSDENKNICAKSHIPCPPFAFRCSYGACIDGSKKCDGKQDCVDNSDENIQMCGTPIVKPLSNNSNCSTGNFQCDSGQCVSEWTICDGETNCRDGSDETDSRCANFRCPQIVGFQCSYGGCIDKNKECNGNKDCRDGSDEENCATKGQAGHTGTSPTLANIPAPVFGKGCELPLQPDGGKYKVANCPDDDVSDKCRRIPKTKVAEYTSLMYECTPGFALSDRYNNVRYCINSTWVPEPAITCLELCKGLKSSTVSITCTHWGRTVNCSAPALPMTKARLKCKDSYRIRGPSSSGELVCQQNGRWSDVLFHCVAECGIRTGDKAVPLITYGQNTSAVEYPWHTGLYKENASHVYDLFCGGSIITPYLILTAAHCVVDPYTKRKTPSAVIKIAVGKTTRAWNVKDVGEQRFDIMEIFVHSDYRADDNHYAFDIAILEVKGEITIGRVAMPVCIEWIPPWTKITDGTEGTAVGWGRNELDKLSEILMSVKLPYLTNESCKRKSSFVFKKFVTHDKFCGQFKNGSGVQQGDSGGGLVFLKPENHLYYIRGIVSTKPKDQNEFATFTNISEKTNIDFITEIRSQTNSRHE